MAGIPVATELEPTESSHCQHIEVETKLPPFHRQNFQMHFVNENVIFSLNISLKCVAKVRINNFPWISIIGLDNDLEPTRGQAINWINDG